MVSAGITPTEEQVEIFNTIKIDKKFRCLILALNKERNKLETVATHDRNFTIKDLEKELPNNDCRFVVFDFEFQTYENPPRDTSKLLLICWVPDIAPIKVKVPFTSTKGEIKAAFPGIAKDVQASDCAILDYEELRKECC